jgi:hypothetical protein
MSAEKDAARVAAINKAAAAQAQAQKNTERARQAKVTHQVKEAQLRESERRAKKGAGRSKR